MNLAEISGEGRHPVLAEDGVVHGAVPRRSAAAPGDRARPGGFPYAPARTRRSVVAMVAEPTTRLPS